MDLEQIIACLRSSLDSPTPDTNYDSRGETLGVQPLQQPSCSNQSLSLLDACSDEDTVKSYLVDIDEEIGPVLMIATTYPMACLLKA
uniref:Uncharacterized protein n=1 Tax=Tetranychus urticae TaxID=32264 RepID=T1JSW7_TETUR